MEKGRSGCIRMQDSLHYIQQEQQIKEKRNYMINEGNINK